MKKRWMVLSIIVLCNFLFSNEASAQTFDRIFGANRYETAAKISQALDQHGDTVIIANGLKFVDALPAATLANHIHAPILLTDEAHLAPETMTEIERIQAKKAIIVGGTSVVAETVVTELESMGLETLRLAGEDRTMTSVEIYKYLDQIGSITSVVLASSMADAVSSSAYRGGEVPLIFVKEDSSAVDFVAGLTVTKVVLGGDHAVSESTMDRLGAEERIFGNDRFETAIKLAEKTDAQKLLLVNAFEFVDGFTASTFAHQSKAVILLTPQDRIEEQTCAFISQKTWEKITLIGGPKAISDQVFDIPEPEPEPEPEPTGPMVALTFDDGPTEGPTDKILDIAKAYGAKVTFFVVGERIAGREWLLKRAHQEGHEIGNHSFHHPDLTSLSWDGIRDQIVRTDNAVYNVTGVVPVLCRPTYGSVNDLVRSAVPYPLINWSVDTADWRTRDAASTTQAILGQLQDGDIVLMHDLYGSTAQAMETVIPELTRQGYRLVTVSELFRLKNITPQSGFVYRHAKE